MNDDTAQDFTKEQKLEYIKQIHLSQVAVHALLRSQPSPKKRHFL